LQIHARIGDYFACRLSDEQIKTTCLIFFVAAVVPYLLAMRSFLKDKRIQNTVGRK
jgi:hypothetical protein